MRQPLTFRGSARQKIKQCDTDCQLIENNEQLSTSESTKSNVIESAKVETKVAPLQSILVTTTKQDGINDESIRKIVLEFVDDDAPTQQHTVELSELTKVENTLQELCDELLK